MSLKKHFQNHSVFWIGILIIIIGLLAVYRTVVFKGEVLFPSNFLASFYSPWSTVKFQGWEQGIPAKPVGGNDQVRMFYPFRTFANLSRQNGEFPLWNPYNFSGSPFLANFQSEIFYPLNLLYLVFPQITAWSILVILQLILGTGFMYLYLRELKIGGLASFLGGFTFGFSGFMLVWSQENAVVGQSAIWFPLILLFIEKFLSSLKIRHYFLLVASLVCCILAGFLQVTFYIFVSVFFYILYRVFQRQLKNKWRTLGVLLSAFIASILLCAVQLLPSAQAFYESARSVTSIEVLLQNYLLPLKFFIKVIASDIFGNPATYNHWGQGFYHESMLYIGAVPLALAFFSVRKLFRDNFIRFFVLLSLISFLLSVKSFFTDWFLRLPIPLVNTFLPSRIFFLTSSGLSVLSAFGLSSWLETKNNRENKPFYVIIILFCSLLVIFAGLYLLSAMTNNTNRFIELFAGLIKPHGAISIQTAKVALRNIIIPLSMLLSVIPLTIWKRKLKISGFIIILIVCLGQFYFLNKYAVSGNKEFLYPDHFIFNDVKENLVNYERFLSFGQPVLGNVNLVKQVYSPDGIDPVFPRRYGELIFAAKNQGKLISEIPRIEVNLSEYYENEDIIDNNRRLKLMSLLGVKRVYNYEKDYKDPKKFPFIFPSSVFRPLWKKDNWQAYENSISLPRVFLADEYLVENDPQRILDLVFDPKTDLGTTVILEEEPGINIKKSNQQNSNNRVDIISYKGSRVDMKVNTDANQLLFISDNYYPGWQANVDNQPVKVFRADYTFRAIAVPQGSHTVTFYYYPDSFKNGLIISVATFLLLMIVSIFICLRKRKL
jgi:hypothetical protein